MGLNNAATSRIVVNSAVISYFVNNCKFVINISLILNTFYNTALPDKKIYPYLICYLKFGLRTNQRLYGKTALSVTPAAH